METRITSNQNPKIKFLLRLHKASERKKEGLFLVEGQKEILTALHSGYKLHSIFRADDVDTNIELQYPVPIFTVSSSVYEKITYGIEQEKILAVFFKKERELSFLNEPSKNPLIIVLETVEKPGNLGAILRTADAAGIDAVIVCDPQTDIYNPNVIRASRGAVFNVPLAVSDNHNAYKWLKERNILIASAALTDKAITYHCFNFNQPTALIFGSEANGLSNFWLSRSDVQLIIPMQGSSDSLNVSVSAAIIIFEAVRQRSMS
ncbi:MAG: RNA methyltransferase [Bacteroidales bacterium]|nr:RNA methyltransferase [Bacteroidales bacterium]